MPMCQRHFPVRQGLRSLTNISSGLPQFGVSASPMLHSREKAASSLSTCVLGEEQYVIHNSQEMNYDLDVFLSGLTWVSSASRHWICPVKVDISSRTWRSGCVSGNMTASLSVLISSLTGTSH